MVQKWTCSDAGLLRQTLGLIDLYSKHTIELWFDACIRCGETLSTSVMFSSCDKAEVDVATRYNNKEFAHISTNKRFSDISVCREANPVVSSVKEKSIDQETGKYLSTNKVVIGNPVVSFLKEKTDKHTNNGNRLKDKWLTNGQIYKRKLTKRAISH